MLQNNQTNIKILVVGISSNIFGNPFIDTLIRRINEISSQYTLELNIKAFWDKNSHYDIIHIHWPEFLFYWQEPAENDLLKLETQIRNWKKTTRILYTRHNESVHYSESKTNARLYEIIELNADMVVHLGIYSKNQLNKKVSGQIHYVIPHHIYDSIYSNNILQKRAKRALNISSEKTVILSFGEFRDQQERIMLNTAFQNLNHKNKFLLAPSWHKPNNKIESSSHFFLGNGFVNNNILPFCFSAADIIFIQRIKILNSGNLPMAFLFNKTVIGPQVGNLTELLDNENNFSFNPNIPQSILGSLEKAINIALNQKIYNEQYAKENWNTSKICSLYLHTYKLLKAL